MLNKSSNLYKIGLATGFAISAMVTSVHLLTLPNQVPESSEQLNMEEAEFLPPQQDMIQKAVMLHKNVENL